MNTYDLAGAAAFLNTSESTLQEILHLICQPVGAKHGQSWNFTETALIEFHTEQTERQMRELRETGRVMTTLAWAKSQARMRKMHGRRTVKPKLASVSP